MTILRAVANFLYELRSISWKNQRGRSLPGLRYVDGRLDRVDFTEADLSGADLSKTKFDDCKFVRTNLREADLSGTDLRQVTGLARRQLKRRNVDSSHPPLLPETNRENPQSKPQGEPHD